MAAIVTNTGVDEIRSSEIEIPEFYEYEDRIMIQVEEADDSESNQQEELYESEDIEVIEQDSTIYGTATDRNEGFCILYTYIVDEPGEAAIDPGISDEEDQEAMPSEVHVSDGEDSPGGGYTTPKPGRKGTFGREGWGIGSFVFEEDEELEGFDNSNASSGAQTISLSIDGEKSVSTKIISNMHNMMQGQMVETYPSAQQSFQMLDSIISYGSNSVNIARVDVSPAWQLTQASPSEYSNNAVNDDHYYYETNENNVQQEPLELAANMSMRMKIYNNLF